MTADEPLLRLAEVAEMLSLSQSTVRNAVKSGLLPRIELSSRTHRFRLSDVQILLDTMTIVGKAMGHAPRVKDPTA